MIALRSDSESTPISDEKTQPIESNLHPEYPPHLVLAIHLISAASPDLQKINELKDSPLFEASQVFFEKNSDPKNKSKLVSKRGAKKIFDKVWKHFYRIIGIPREEETWRDEILQQSLQAMDSAFNTESTLPVDQFNKTSLKTEEIIARKNEPLSQNNIARSGGVHRLVAENVPKLKIEDRDLSPLEQSQILQVGTAQLFVDYLLIQKDMAGMGQADEKPKQNYVDETRGSAWDILSDLHQNGWDKYCHPALAKILNDKLKITEAMINKPVPNTTKDRNLHFSEGQNPKRIFGESPKIGVGDLSGLDITVFSLNGQKYRKYNLHEFLNFTPKNLVNKMIYANSSNWHRIPPAESHNKLPFTQFGVSFNFNQEGSNNSEAINKIRGGSGQIAHHLDLKLGDRENILTQYTSHNPEDGQLAKLAMEHVLTILGVKKSSNARNFVEPNTYHPNSPEGSVQRAIEDFLRLTDVEIGISLDRAENIPRFIDAYNSAFVDPLNLQIRSILRQGANVEKTRELLEELNLPVDRQLLTKTFDEICRLLNPKLSRHTILGLILETDGPTANCVFPIEQTARLSFNGFKLLDFLPKYQDPTTLDRTSVTHELSQVFQAIRLVHDNQSLARFGLNPLNYLAIYTQAARNLARLAGRILSNAVVDKTYVMYQISELGKSLSSHFSSALSQTVESLFGAFGLINQQLVVRINLTHPLALQTIVPDINRLNVPRVGSLNSQFSYLPPTLKIKTNQENINYFIFYHNIRKQLGKGQKLENLIYQDSINSHNQKFWQILLITSAYQHYQHKITLADNLSKFGSDHLVANPNRS